MRRYLTLALVTALIAGCEFIELFGGFAGGETGSARLLRFASEQELLDYFLGEIGSRNDQMFRAETETGNVFFDEDVQFLATDDSAAGGAGDVNAAPPPPGAGETPVATQDGGERGFSETTTQEIGVDEADVVKTDGDYLYVISDSTLRIIQIAQPAVVGEVELEGYGREIYLREGKVVALSETFGGAVFGGIDVSVLPVDDIAVIDAPQAEAIPELEVAEPSPQMSTPSFVRPRTIVTVIDVTSPAEPRIEFQTKFDGTQTSTRMIDGTLHLVIANYQYHYYDVLPMLGRAELDLSTVDVASLLPRYEHIDAAGERTEGNVITWEELYRPSDPDGFGVVAVVSMNVDADLGFKGLGIVAEPGLIYSSTEALYLTDTNYDFFGNARETTDIYKFVYVDGTPVAAAAGSVPGRILNQYSMGEHNGYLRVATTVGPTFLGFGERTASANNVYVLGQSGAELQVVGSVEGIAPGESIKAARFLGNRGYVVTFREVDPLYTLDLADPLNPFIAGELKVPGFSTFVVPMDENHLLTVGQYIPDAGRFFAWGVQLSIFDVSDFANPVQKFSTVIGVEGGASSEALYNPKAFTYFAERGLLALPVSIYPEIVFFDDFGRDFEDPDFAFTEDGEGAFGGSDGISVDSDAPPSEPGEPGLAEPNADEPIEPDPIDVILPIGGDGFEGLFVYEVSTESGFTELGRISTRFEDRGYRWPQFTRGVFIDDDVWAVTDYGLRGGSVVRLGRIDNASLELFYGRDFAVDLVEPGIAVEEPPGR